MAQVASLIEVLDKRRVEGRHTNVMFVDLAKAYDSVPYEALMAKLLKFGISGRAMKWIPGPLRKSEDLLPPKQWHVLRLLGIPERRS